MGTEISLRFTSASPQSLSLYFVRKEGEAVSTGAIEKSMPSHGLLDPIEPWRLGSEILPKFLLDIKELKGKKNKNKPKLFLTSWMLYYIAWHSICASRGVPGLGSINSVGSQLEDVLRVTHPIMSRLLFRLSTSLNF
ncbi:uncharacterized protein LOC143436077 [Arvicanthis niloticus]|uniref:uncharacterized protein LOC143436077 n=1 Tax=Arvicanthis niloticus TaxID=61156 RepID=UPI00403D17A0